MYLQDNFPEYMVCLREHIEISLLAFLLAAFIGILAGYFCAEHGKIEGYVTGLFQILRIIPSVAILILLIPIMGVGIKPAMVALVLLAVPPILMNTVTGFREVPDFMLETAVSLGMTKKQILWQVRVPQAMPMIFAGLKIAMVEIIASAAIAAKIGAGGLGGIILTGLGLNRMDMLLVGGISVAVLSVTASFLFGQLEKKMMRYRYL